MGPAVTCVPQESPNLPSSSNGESHEAPGHEGSGGGTSHEGDEEEGSDEAPGHEGSSCCTSHEGDEEEGSDEGNEVHEGHEEVNGAPCPKSQLISVAQAADPP